MKLSEIKPMLERTGYFVGYNELAPGELKQPLRTPYIFYLLPDSNNFFADGVVYQKITRLRVELYTGKKDFAAEQNTEAVLTASGIGWERTEAYIRAERLFQIIYEGEVMISE